MATTRPFSRYTGGPIPNNAEQIGNLYFGNENTLLEVGGVKWWNGPDEDSGYIIAYEDASGNHIGADGVQAYLGFRRSTAKTEASFIQLATKVTGESFATGNEAKTYLNANGMWTSFGLGTPSGSGSWYFYSGEGALNAPPPNQDGNAIFLIRDNQNVVTETFNPNKSNGTDEIYLNLSDSTGTDYTTQFAALQTNGGTISITQGANTVTYTSTTPGAFIDTGSGFFMIQTGPATQTVNAASPFVYGDPISISFS